MTDHEHGEANANDATGFSGFGGHKLEQVTSSNMVAAGSGVEAFVNDAGEMLGAEDVEQVLAVAKIPGVQGELQSVLRLEAADFDTLLEQALETLLPKERRDLVSEPALPEFGLGVLQLSPEELAAAEASAAEIAVGEEPSAEAVAAAVAVAPPSANLISYMSPIRQQGSRGTCVSFTLTELHQYALRRRGVSVDLSEQHLYYETKLIDGDPNACGTHQANAGDALRDHGQCREFIWPYNPNAACNSHGALPTQARPDGMFYRLTIVSVSTRNVLAYKERISGERPVGLSFPVYDSWRLSAETRRSGRITLRLGTEPQVGGHAILLVGYQDDPNQPGGGYFIGRNSWGTGWGYQCPYGAGYCTIPYAYITNEAWEAFTY
jgi:hypothetical protein